MRLRKCILPLTIMLTTLIFSCGLLESKPGPASKREAYISMCGEILKYDMLASKEISQNKRDEINAIFLQCVLYSLTLSDDPLDCTGNDLQWLLEKTKIFSPRGCSTVGGRE